MTLTILHITDLHFGWDGEDANKRAERSVCLDGLLSVIGELDPFWKPSVICLSGDVGWRGAASDYADAKEWLDRLLAKCNIGYERLLICAGNHDAARTEAKKNARPGDASEADEVLGVPIASQFIAPFAQFVQFCKGVQVKPMKIGAEESYLVGERVIDGYRFVSLNSAWFAKDDKDKEKLWLGLPHLRVLEAAGQLPLVRGKSDSLCTIALVHHPKEWLHPHESNAWTSRPNTWDYVAGRCHILLSGHTHGEVRRADRIAEGVYHFTGGSAYAGASHFNSFRLLRVDTKQIIYISYEFDPRSAENEWKASKEISFPLATEGPTPQSQSGPDISQLVRSGVLLREALKAVVAVSYGGGPTTNLHRRLEAGERWIREARKSLELMSRDGDVSAVFLDYLRSLTEDLAAFAAKVKRCLPRAGETGPREYAVLSEFRQALDVKKEELSDRLEHEGVLADVYEPTKWKILGFEDEESFRDYVDPWLHQLLRKKDPKVRDLAQRLLKDPIFTPAGLASEGHRKSIVMDVVNALVREDGAIWTDRETGSKAEGRVTSAGRDLLTKLIARFYA